MKPILWLDQQLLKFFTKIAKDLNWFMGLSSITLAFIFLIIAYVFLFQIIGRKEWVANLVFCLFSFGLYCGVTFGLVTLHDQLHACEVKNFDLFYSAFVARMLIVSLSIYMMMRSPTKEEPTYLFVVTSTSFIAWVYSCCVERPPFKKSQAWRGVKSWFSPGFTQPQAEPIPVRSN